MPQVMSAKGSDSIKTKLLQALSGQQLDYDNVLALATALAAQDPDYVRFSVDAAIIGRLGEELVARQETAVSEIVKNSYDADATEVTLTFSRTERPGGRLVIEDNGNGMTRDQLVAGFMRLASAEKALDPTSPFYGRTRAGKKGIGRFAVQRLGARLTLVTQTAKDKTALKVEIDWRRFQRQSELGAIASRIERVAARGKGTLLIVDDLREAWNEESISRAYRFVDELLQPFPLLPSETITNSTGEMIDPGFKVSFLKSDGIHHRVVASEKTLVFDHEVGVVTASIDSEGSGTWTFASKKLDIRRETNTICPHEDDPESRYAHLRDVYLEAHYFIYFNELIPGSLLRSLQDLGSRRGGIRLYRNGFRVLPYGEPENDWLSLDVDEGKRRDVLGPLGNKNWFGFIRITDRDGKQFEETSSREGLLESPSFEELKVFASSVLKAVTLRVSHARGRKATAGQKGFVSRHRAGSSAERLRKAAGALLEEADRATTIRSDDKQAMRSETLEVLRDQAETILEVATVNEELVQEVTMLRILSSLGLTIGEFSHEVKTLIASITSELVLLAERPDLSKETSQSVDAVSRTFTLLETYVAYFDQTISANVQRELKPQDLEDVTYDFFRSFQSAAKKNGVTLAEPVINARRCVTKPMHSSEWASILVNLFTNSVKAIRRARRVGKGSIEIRVGRTANTVTLDFCDNGDGIPEANEQRIFEAFFTTSTPRTRQTIDQQELLGTGLGLKIVSDIIEANLGTISILKPPPSGFTTCFRLLIPAN